MTVLPHSRRLAAALRFVVLFGALLVPWPGVSSAFVRAYSRFADACVGGTLSSAGHSVHVLGPQTGLEPWRAGIVIVSRATGELSATTMDCWRAVYLPMSVYLALAFAWPRRRWMMALTIAGAGTLVLAFLPALLVAETATRAGAMQVRVGTNALLLTLNRALWAPPGMAFIVPVLLFFALLALANRVWPTPPAATAARRLSAR